MVKNMPSNRSSEDIVNEIFATKTQNSIKVSRFHAWWKVILLDGMDDAEARRELAHRHRPHRSMHDSTGIASFFQLHGTCFTV